jgi:hypothetical protein
LPDTAQAIGSRSCVRRPVAGINGGRIDAGSSEARRGDVALMSARPLNRFARAIHLAISDAYISIGGAFCVIEKQLRL